MLTRVGQTDELNRHIKTVANDTHILSKAINPGRIDSLWHERASGSCTLTIAINGTTVTSLSVSVSTSGTEVAATALNTFAIGDRITGVITSNSSAIDLFFRLKITYT